MAMGCLHPPPLPRSPGVRNYSSQKWPVDFLSIVLDLWKRSSNRCCCLSMSLAHFDRFCNVFGGPKWLQNHRKSILEGVPFAERPKSTKHCKIHIETTFFDPKTGPKSIKNRSFGYLGSHRFFDLFQKPKKMLKQSTDHF